jgi:hypothetical protein
MDYAFANCVKFKGGGLESWSTQSLRTSEGMFLQCFRFKKDISGWSMEKVTNAAYMFYDATKFKHSIKKWTLSQIQHIDFFLYNAKKYKSSLREWDLSSAVSCRDFATDSGLKDSKLPAHTESCM